MRLSTANVSVKLGSVTVVRDAILSIEPGDFVAVVGPNGAGKSTLLRAMAGLLVPAAGDIRLDDKPLPGWSPRALARAIAYLPQSRIVHWPLTAQRVVALGRGPHGSSPNEDAIIIARAMAEMDVTALAERRVSQLSGGELARVLVARALAQATPIIIADEPTAGLDPAHQLALFERFAQVAREQRTVIVALHDLSLAARYCQRIVLLKDGRIIADGTPDAVFTPGNLSVAYGIDARLVRVDAIPVVLPVALC